MRDPSYETYASERYQDSDIYSVLLQVYDTASQNLYFVPEDPTLGFNKFLLEFEGEGINKKGLEGVRI